MVSGGWKGSNRRQRLPGDWASRRKAAIGGQCTEILKSGARCPRTATEADHVVAGRDDHDDLQGKCKTHHARKSAREGVAGRAPALSNRPRIHEEHPGRR